MVNNTHSAVTNNTVTPFIMLVFPLLRQAGTILFGSHTLITLSNAHTLLVPLGQAVRVESAVNASKFESMSKTPTSQSLFAEQTNSAKVKTECQAQIHVYQGV